MDCDAIKSAVSYISENKVVEKRQTGRVLASCPAGPAKIEGKQKFRAHCIELFKSLYKVHCEITSTQQVAGQNLRW
jgi:hypothetical protein